MARRLWPIAFIVGNLPPRPEERFPPPGASCVTARLVWSLSTCRCRRHHASFQPRPAETVSTDAIPASALFHLCAPGRGSHRAETPGPPHLSVVDSVGSTQSGNVLCAASDLSLDATPGMAGRKIRKFLGRSV